MVNVKNLFGMAVMASALVACSSNDDVNPSGNQQESAGTSYASFKINLPTVSGTRADAGTPEFDGGVASEYAVKNATILIFKKGGSSEGSYTYVTSAKLGDMAPWQDRDPKNKGVTTEATVVAEVNGLTQSDIDAKNYYALVLLNNEVGGNLKVKLPAANATFGEWSVSQISNANYANISDGIIMANAPQYVENKEPETLVHIDGIYKTKDEAASKTATNVYVERGLAKVTVVGGDKSISGGQYDGASVKIQNWTLDVTNKKTYGVHVTDGLSTSYADIWKSTSTRFFDGTNSEFKRVYWSKDPNYTGFTSNQLSDYTNDFSIMDNHGNFTETPFVSPTPAGTAANYVASGESMYCFENTFDIADQTQGQTTRVVFKAKYTPKDYSSETDDALLSYENKGTFFMLGSNPQTWTPSKFVSQVKAYTVEAYNADPDHSSSKINVDDVTVDLRNADFGTTGTIELSALDINIKGESSAYNDAVAAKLGKITVYKGGTSYYIARVKHFNELTPWSPGDATYSNDNAKWLGRYGLVRNNWYYLTVDKVSNPGSPIVPTITPNNPDDENQNYISVSVKILDWAKRAYSVDL